MEASPSVDARVEGGERWREVTTSVTAGKPERDLARSEWTREFREKVNSSWLKSFRVFQDESDSHPELTDAERQKLFAEHKSQFCSQCGITIEDFQGILDAVDLQQGAEKGVVGKPTMSDLQAQQSVRPEDGQPAKPPRPAGDMTWLAWIPIGGTGANFSAVKGLIPAGDLGISRV
jgi:hypothetical protein